MRQGVQKKRAVNKCVNNTVICRLKKDNIRNKRKKTNENFDILNLFFKYNGKF